MMTATPTEESSARPVAAPPAPLVSAHADDSEAVNAIPEALADVLGRPLVWPVDGGILQVNVAAHSGADGWSRRARLAVLAARW